MTYLLLWPVFQEVLPFLQKYVNNLKPNVQAWVNRSFANHYETDLNASALNWLWAISTAAMQIGALFGSMFIGILAESQVFGRRKGLMVVAGITILGGILNGVCKASQSFELFAGARFILGIALGLGKTVFDCFQTCSPIPPVSRIAKNRSVH